MNIFVFTSRLALFIARVRPCVREGNRLGSAAAWSKCPAIKLQLSSSQFRVPRRELRGV